MEDKLHGVLREADGYELVGAAGSKFGELILPEAMSHVDLSGFIEGNSQRRRLFVEQRGTIYEVETIASRPDRDLGGDTRPRVGIVVVTRTIEK